MKPPKSPANAKGGGTPREPGNNEVRSSPPREPGFMGNSKGKNRWIAPKM